MLVQLVLVLVMHGTATKLQNPRNIKLEGAVEGEANFDGSKNIKITTTQANIAVLEGYLAQDGESKEVSTNYPEGFNKTNCVVISAEGIRGTTESGDMYVFGTMYDSISYIRGGVPLSVVRRNSDILICAKNIILSDESTALVRPITSETGYKYRIVLLKIE